MVHITVPEAEALLDKEIKVLDHGFVRLIDYMGSDDRISSRPPAPPTATAR